jgi:putative aminopeptidase FrvX
MGMAGFSAEQRALLQELIYARGPVGLEAEVATICLRELEAIADEAWIDDMGNAVGVIRAPNVPREQAAARAVRVMAHMDEIALIVKRIHANGHLRVIKLGGLLPISFGQVPVDIMGDFGVLPGILSIGPLHVTKETADFSDTSREVLHWADVFVATRLSRQELFDRGVHAGTRVVVGKYMRHLFEFQDCIAAHFMDDRALIVVALEALREVAARRQQLQRDVYVVCTVEEEVTCAGAHHAARQLPGDEVIALEVGPVAAEYDTELCERPIVLYADMRGFYSPGIAEKLKQAVERTGIQPQLALFENFATDASSVIASGNTALAGALCIPTQNTHGFEIIHKDSIPIAAAALAGYLTS